VQTLLRDLPSPRCAESGRAVHRKKRETNDPLDRRGSRCLELRGAGPAVRPAAV